MSIETACENIEIAVLREQAALASFSIVNYDSDEQAPRDRIIVKAEVAEPALKHADGLRVKQWMVPMSVLIKLGTENTATMETAIAAVNTAHAGPTAPASAITAGADTLAGWRIENIPEGNRENEDKSRQFENRFAFYVQPL